MISRLRKIIENVFRREGPDEEAYVKNLLSEFRNKRHLYEEFCDAVYKLVDAFLKEGRYKYQITNRTKTIERLREKILRKNEEGVIYKSIMDIEDLAGIRVLFYSESDKERFVREFQKEKGGNMHIKESKKRSGYESTHIILTFSATRLQLPEYKHFFGLKSEIQVTSILNHAWAEIEHDFIYKDVNGLKARDPEKFRIMKQKLGEILEGHIKQASVEFEKVIEWMDHS